MPGSTGVDMSRLLKGLGAARKAALAAATKAVDQFGEMVIGNAQDLAPVATGDLKGSGTAKDKAKVDGGRIVKTVGFTVIYAAAVHEAPLDTKFNTEKEPRAQRKFLETAMRGLAPKFGAFVNDRVRDAVEGGGAQ